MVLYSARSGYISQEKWVGSEFACIVRLSLGFFECYLSRFYIFWTSKSQKIIVDSPPLIPYQGPAIDLLGGLQHPPDPQLLFALCAFHAHIIWAPLALPMSTFFSVLTPDCIYKNTKHNVLIYTQLQLLVVAESGRAENLFRHCFN